MIRNWLEKKGLIKTPAEAKRDDLLATIRNYWYTANDRVSRHAVRPAQPYQC